MSLPKETILSKTRKVVTEVAANLAHIPVLQKPIDAIYKQPGEEETLRNNPILEIGRAYVENLKVIRDMALLSQEEIDLINQTNQLCKQRGLPDVSASEGGADHILKVLGPERTKRLFQGVMESADVTSGVFKAALLDLGERMTLGYDLAASGAKLSDGASQEADKAIWGHAVHLSSDKPELTPRAKIHLTLSHFIARTFTAFFKDDPDPEVQKMIAEKDILLSAMTDVMALKKAQGKPYRIIDDLWGKTRAEGGLGWTKKAREEVYKEVVESFKQY